MTMLPFMFFLQHFYLHLKEYCPLQTSEKVEKERWTADWVGEKGARLFFVCQWSKYWTWARCTKGKIEGIIKTLQDGWRWHKMHSSVAGNIFALYTCSTFWRWPLIITSRASILCFRNNWVWEHTVALLCGFTVLIAKTSANMVAYCTCICTCQEMVLNWAFGLCEFSLLVSKIYVGVFCRAKKDLPFRLKKHNWLVRILSHIVALPM